MQESIKIVLRNASEIGDFVAIVNRHNIAKCSAVVSDREVSLVSFLSAMSIAEALKNGVAISLNISDKQYMSFVKSIMKFMAD